MKRIVPPVRLKIHGKMREIVEVRPDQFVEKLPDGRLALHPGHLVLEQEPGWTISTPKPCSVCKQPAYTTTAQGRAYHMWCEKRITVLPDDVIANITFGVAQDLGAQIIGVRG